MGELSSIRTYISSLNFLILKKENISSSKLFYLNQREILFPATNNHPGLQQLVQTLYDIIRYD